MYTTRDYLIKIERMIALPDDVGWGRYLESREEPRLALTAYLFWAVLKVMTIFIPFFMLLKDF